jgi:hypothetical protein
MCTGSVEFALFIQPIYVLYLNFKINAVVGRLALLFHILKVMGKILRSEVFVLALFFMISLSILVQVLEWYLNTGHDCSFLYASKCTTNLPFNIILLYC